MSSTLDTILQALRRRVKRPLQASHLGPFNSSGLPLIGVASAAAALTLWAFLGLETATVPTDVVKDPQHTVPRATVVGATIAGLATMLACTLVIGMLPADVLRTSAAPMAEAARRTWGDAAGVAIGVVAAVSCFGALIGWVLLQAQTTLAAAQEGLFPALFARLDKWGTPWFGLLMSSALASASIASNYTRTLVALFTSPSCCRPPRRWFSLSRHGTRVVAHRHHGQGMASVDRGGSTGLQPMGADRYRRRDLDVGRGVGPCRTAVLFVARYKGGDAVKTKSSCRSRFGADSSSLDCSTRLTPENENRSSQPR